MNAEFLFLILAPWNWEQREDSVCKKCKRAVEANFVIDLEVFQKRNVVSKKYCSSNI